MVTLTTNRSFSKIRSPFLDNPFLNGRSDFQNPQVLKALSSDVFQQRSLVVDLNGIPIIPKCSTNSADGVNIDQCFRS